MAPLSVPPARGRWDYDDDSDDPWIADSLRGSPQTDSGEQGSPQTDDGEQGSPQTNNGEWGDSQAGDNGCKGTSGADRKSRRLRTSRELSLLTESLTRVLGGENTAFDELLLEDPCLLDSEFVDGVDLQDVSVIADVIRSLAASRGMRARTVGSAQRRPREWGTRVPKSSLRSVFKAVKESRATSEGRV